MLINEKKNAIELSKKEAKAAAKFGTTEYKQLQEARRDYPRKCCSVTRSFGMYYLSYFPLRKNTHVSLLYCLK